MKSKGFIAMSIVYSFFIVFISITSLLLANYMQNRILVRSMNDDIKNNLTNEANKILYYEEILNGSDPVLTPGLIPVIISDDGTITIADEFENWYDYETKQWANAVTVIDSSYTYRTAESGTIIPMTSVSQMYVWIPRYDYNAGSIERASIAIEVNFVNKTNDAHIAFCWGDNCQTDRNNEENIELSGFWVGKFEQAQDNKIIPNETSIHSQYFTGYITNATGMNEKNGLNNQSDIHIIKNTEWGAVAYLSQSIYGICSEQSSCNEVSSSTSTVTGSNWTSATGKKTSTTHNISGVYDMAGGKKELVMSNVNAYLYNALGTNTNITNKYYDDYTINPINALSNDEKFGDAMLELYPDTNLIQLTQYSTKNWNYDNMYVGTQYMSRGGSTVSGTTAGIWAVDAHHSAQDNKVTTRSILTPII